MTTPIVWTCYECGNDWTSTGEEVKCPACGSSDIECMGEEDAP